MNSIFLANLVERNVYVQFLNILLLENQAQELQVKAIQKNRELQ